MSSNSSFNYKAIGTSMLGIKTFIRGKTWTEKKTFSSKPRILHLLKVEIEFCTIRKIDYYTSLSSSFIYEMIGVSLMDIALVLKTNHTLKS